PGARPAVDVALRDQLIVGTQDRVAPQTRDLSQLAARGESAAGGQPAAQNGRAQLVIELAVERLVGAWVYGKRPKAREGMASGHGRGLQAGPKGSRKARERLESGPESLAAGGPR